MDKSLQLGQEIERLGTHRRLIVEKGMIIVAGLDHRVADHIAHEAADLALRGGRIAGEEAFAENLVARSAPLGEVEIIALGERSEGRRVGKECVSTGRSRWSP